MEEEVMQYGIDSRTGQTPQEASTVINRLFVLEQAVGALQQRTDEQAKAIDHMAHVLGVKWE